MAKFKANIKGLTDKQTIQFTWRSLVGTAVYVAVPSLVNKYLSKDKPIMDGIVGLFAGLAATILFYLFTGWKEVLYTGITHTGGQLTYYALPKFAGIEPFNAFPEEATTSTNTNTVEDYISTSNYALPQEYSYTPVSDGLNVGVNNYQEFYN